MTEDGPMTCKCGKWTDEQVTGMYYDEVDPQTWKLTRYFMCKECLEKGYHKIRKPYDKLKSYI